MQTFGLTAEDIARRLNGVSRLMSSSNARLSEADLEGFVIEGAGQIMALLERLGVDADALAAAQGGAYQLCRSAIIHYARWQALEVMGSQDTAAQRAQDAWRSALARIRDQPAELGSAEPSQDSSTSNLGLGADDQAQRRDNYCARRWSGDYGNGW